MTPPRPEKTGRDFEKFIALKLDDQDIDYKPQVHVGESIYGTKRTVDFVAEVPGYPDGLVLQIKYQAIAGSVDEKFPYEVLCIDAGNMPTAIVLDGGGYKQKAAAWLKDQVEKTPNLVAVLEGTGEF